MNLQRLIRRAYLILIDTAVSYFCMLVAAYIVTDGLAIVWQHSFTLLGLIILQVIILGLFKVYSIRLIDSSLELAVRGQSALVLSGLITLIVVMIYERDLNFSLRIFIPYLTSTSLLILGYRIVYRTLFSYHVKGSDGDGFPRTIVYGAGEIGMQLARQYFKKKLPYSLMGFIDDDPFKQESMLQGLVVMGTLDTLEAVLKETNAQDLIIGISNLPSNRLRKALDIAAKFGLQVQIVPSLLEIEQGHKSIADLRSINYDDLLGRNPIAIDRTPIEEMVLGKKVLVTGAGGSIGSEICRQLLSYRPSQLLLLDIDETELHNLSLRLHDYRKEFSAGIMPIVCDVKDEKKVERIFAKYEPDLVFHAAAYKHVPMMEYYPEEAIYTNILGTYNVFSAATHHHAKRCILISTDKAVNPTNVMGATKRVAEQVARMLTTDETEIVCVRFGNVLGSRGSMLPLFIEQIHAGLPITVTDKRIIRYFMTISEAVSLVFLAGSISRGGEVMVLDMGEQVNIYDFAKRLIQQYGDGRSDVVITGLRPGEKLYEEKLSDKDRTIPTGNAKVFKAEVKGTLDKRDFDVLIKNISSMEPEQLVEFLQKIVPEFAYQGRVKNQN